MEWLAALGVAALPFAIILACPIGMFLAMRFGMSAMSGHPPEREAAAPGQRRARLEHQQAQLASEVAAARAELVDEEHRAARA